MCLTEKSSCQKEYHVIVIAARAARVSSGKYQLLTAVRNSTGVVVSPLPLPVLYASIAPTVLRSFSVSSRLEPPEGQSETNDLLYKNLKLLRLERQVLYYRSDITNEVPACRR